MSGSKFYQTASAFLSKKILGKINQLRKFNQSLHAILSQEMINHCEIADIESESLIILVDSPSWATAIRYQAKDLLAALKARHTDLKQVEKIQFLVRPKK